MPSWLEFTGSIRGAWRLALRDPAGMALFNLTVVGFWRSFAAALLMLPIFALMVVMNHDPLLSPAPAQLWVVHGISYVLHWVMFPVVMIWVTRFLGLGAGYGAFIIAINWSQLIQTGLFLPVSILLWLEVDQVANLLGLLLFAWVAFYDWFIARTALQAPAGTAAGIVALNVILNLLMEQGLNRLMPV